MPTIPLRTKYLLSLEGIQLEEQSRAATDAAKASGTEKKQDAPLDLLEEAFELNTQLEEMRMAEKIGEDDVKRRKDLEQAQQNFTTMLTEIQERLKALWSQWDSAVDAPDAAAKSPPCRRWSLSSTTAVTSATWCATSTSK